MSPLWDDWWSRVGEATRPWIYFDRYSLGLPNNETVAKEKTRSLLAWAKRSQAGFNAVQREYVEMCIAWSKVRFAAHCFVGMLDLVGCASRDHSYRRDEPVIEQSGPMLKRKRTKTVRMLPDSKFDEIKSGMATVAQCKRLHEGAFFKDEKRCRRAIHLYRSLYRAPSWDQFRRVPGEGSMMRQCRKCMFAQAIRAALRQKKEADLRGQIDGWLIKNGLFNYLDAKPTKGLEHYAAAGSVHV